MFDINSNSVDITKNGLFPQMFAPEAVKKVTAPVNRRIDPTMKVDTMSGLALYCLLIITKPGEIIGPSLFTLDRLCRQKL